MKRLFIPAAAAAAVLVFAVVNAGARGGHHGNGHGNGHGLTVVEHAATDAVTNGDASTDKLGNVLTFANPVYDQADQTRVGSDQGYCIRVVLGSSWECNWTTFLPKGQITVEGPFSDRRKTNSPQTRHSRLAPRMSAQSSWSSVRLSGSTDIRAPGRPRSPCRAAGRAARRSTPARRSRAAGEFVLPRESIA